MKTAEELNAIKTELEALDRKLSFLSEEELAQVAGGGSRRTDDREQTEAHKCYNFAWFYIESRSTALPPSAQEYFIGEIKALWDKTLPWHLADPNELIPKTEVVIKNLELYKNLEEPIRDAYDKLNEVMPYLREMQRKDAE